MKKDILAVLYHTCRPKNVDDAIGKKTKKNPSEGHIFNHDECPKSEEEQRQSVKTRGVAGRKTEQLVRTGTSKTRSELFHTAFSRVASLV